MVASVHQTIMLENIFFHGTEAVVRRCSVKTVFLKISQNLQENASAKISFLIKLQASTCIFIQKETLTHVFSCEFCKIFKSTIFIEHLRWLLHAKCWKAIK